MATIETRKIDDLLPDPNNVNRHTQKGHGLVENSIRRRGVGRGILAAGKNTEKPVIMAGNLTHEKARDAGIDEVVFVHTTGNQLVVTVRDDLDPTSPEAIALGIEDNESGKLSYNPDIDLLAAMSAGDNGVLSRLKEDDKIFGDMLAGMIPEDDDTYSRKVETPIYEIKGENPKISELYNDEQYKKLLSEIDASNIPDEQKDFLRIAATRHIVFDFSKTAEYYAHANKELQGLMENNALVIIDFNKAIELGYVKLSEELKKQFAKEYPNE